VTPCDLLFIGDAPGRAEDVLGKPLVGPGKQLFDALLRIAVEWSDVGNAPSTFYANAIGCYPGERQPTPEELWACFPRLEAEGARARPRRVVFLGKIADGAARKLFPRGVRMASMEYLLKCGGVGSPAAIKFCRDLAAILKEIHAEKDSEGSLVPDRPGSQSVNVGAVRYVPSRVPPFTGRLAVPYSKAGDAVREPYPRPPSKLVRGFFRAANLL
jgi:uracil-DNA glycosylase family 4